MPASEFAAPIANTLSNLSTPHTQLFPSPQREGGTGGLSAVSDRLGIAGHSPHPNPCMPATGEGAKGTNRTHPLHVNREHGLRLNYTVDRMMWSRGGQMPASEFAAPIANTLSNLSTPHTQLFPSPQREGGTG